MLSVGVFGIVFPVFHSHPATVDELVGAWKCIDKPWTIEFARDGGILMQTIGPVQSGSYQVDAAGNLKVVMKDGKGFQAKAEIKNDDLVLTDPDWTKSSFKRR